MDSNSCSSSVRLFNKKDHILESFTKELTLQSKKKRNPRQSYKNSLKSCKDEDRHNNKCNKKPNNLIKVNEWVRFLFKKEHEDTKEEILKLFIFNHSNIINFQFIP